MTSKELSVPLLSARLDRVEPWTAPLSAKFNDLDLRRQALVLEDPREQPDLTYQIEDGVALLDIINTYRFPGYPAEKIFCVECQGHHHAKGFTALTTRGQRVLLGSKCGADVFGESWKSAEQRMKERVNRQYELKRLDRFGPLYKAMRAALDRWTGPIGDLAFRRIGFSAALEELYQRAHEAAIREGGRLTYSKRVRQKMGNEPDWVQVTYGMMHGPEMFVGFDRFNIVTAIDDGFKSLDAVASSITHSENCSTTALRQRRARMERSFDQLEEVARAYEGGQNFFTEASFKQLSEWSFIRNEPHYRYIYEDGLLRHVNGLGAVAQMAPLPDLDDTILDLIREYRSAD